MFLLFAGESFYASGGFNDFIDTFDSLEEAEAAGKLLQEKGRPTKYDTIERLDWFQVVNQNEIVLKSECRPYGDNDESTYTANTETVVTIELKASGPS